jgi:hypothetical protein
VKGNFPLPPHEERLSQGLLEVAREGGDVRAYTERYSIGQFIAAGKSREFIEKWKATLR